MATDGAVHPRHSTLTLANKMDIDDNNLCSPIQHILSLREPASWDHFPFNRGVWMKQLFHEFCNKNLVFEGSARLCKMHTQTHTHAVKFQNE